jgi:hypothetical protein
MTCFVPRAIARSTLCALVVGLLACSPQGEPSAAAGASTAAAVAPSATLPSMTVHKSPTCDCCRRWVEHARQAGFPVEVENTHHLNEVKLRLGVPAAMGSCHTVEVDGYVIEGHVPIEDVKRLLAERPAARGLAVPGMPLGSPGMEHPSGRVQPYVVHLIGMDGTPTEFARHGE